MEDWIKKYLANSGILDTETLGRETGSGIHELSYYSFAKNQVTEYLPAPTVVDVLSGVPQDEANMRSFKGNVYSSRVFADWRTALQDMLVNKYKMQLADLQTDDNIRVAIATVNSFLYKHLYENKAYPHLLGGAPTAQELARREAEFKRSGVSYKFGGYGLTAEEMYKPGGVLHSAIRETSDPKMGSTVWIANANFESKQIGAYIGAMAQAGGPTSDGFKGVLESRSSTPEPFYVTGAAVNRARSNAQLTGDWTQVWKAYRDNAPKAGEVAVRDILDLSRSILSYGQKFNLLDVRTKQTPGVGIDYQERLLRGAFEPTQEGRFKGMLASEAHRAAEDAAKSERYVLEKSLQALSALERLEKGGTDANTLLREAAEGRGPLAPVMRYFEIYNQSLAPAIRRRHLLQQFERGLTDLETKGYATHTTGIDQTISERQTTPTGRATTIQRNLYAQKYFRDPEEYGKYVSNTGEFQKYGLDPDAEWKAMQGFIDKELPHRPTATRATLATEYVETETGDSLVSYFDNNAARLSGLSGSYNTRRIRAGGIHSSKGLHTWATGKIAGAIKRAPLAFGVASVFGLVGGTLAAVTTPSEERYAPQNSILSMSYSEYSAARDLETATHDGFPEKGLAKMTRSSRTDFGSPYQGPATSLSVIVHQDLLRAREQEQRKKYGGGSFDERPELRSMFTYTRQRSTALSGDPTDGLFSGLRNQNGMKVLNIDDGYDFEIEDVDTVKLHKRGMFASLQRFMGLGGSYTFRLEGIDATETSHGMFDDSWHTPQPGAQESIAGFKRLVQKGGLQMVFDPKDNTYGRGVGTLFSNGQNVNQKLVEQGLAAHLPYGSYTDAHANWDAMRKAEQKAVDAKRGIWSTAWAQTYRHFTDSAGTQITFNTFARPSKIAENYKTMELISLMEQAQEKGAISPLQAETASAIGKSWSQFGDKMTPYQIEGNIAANYRASMPSLIRDNTSFMQTQGTGSNPNKLETKNFNDLNGYLAVDSMGSTNSPYTKNAYQAYEVYGIDKKRAAERRARMAAMQRNINNKFGESPINHHRM